MAKTSPLHRVIGAARWDAERPLGRLLILAHAAFLDAGFLPAGAAADGDSIRLPRKVGRTASSLPLRYAAPPLLHWPDAAAAVQLRLCAHGRHLVLYVSITRTSIFRKRRLDTYWVCLDALAAGALLAGGLDDTARALRRDARLAALWSALTDKLCRRVLIDMCAKYGITLAPNFMSLPDDVKAAILARLPDGDDLARVECTCVGLRRLVADHERDTALWKPRYEKLPFLLRLVSDDDEPTTEVNWKKKYAAARLWPFGERFASMRERRRRQIFSPWMDLDMDSFTRFWAFDDTPEPLPEEITTVPRRRGRRRWRAMPRDAGHGNAAVGHDGDKKPRNGTGAVHSPSSRFRWKHR
uniref:F-box domain-containing protein n=1 Tax=Oryza punctata TaxID=4537 RepID=A0A0E0M581_ORYPU